MTLKPPPQGGYRAKTCQVATYRTFIPQSDQLPRDKKSPALEARAISGTIHEEEVISKWAKVFPIHIIDTDTSYATQEAETARLMASPGNVVVIVHPRLPTTKKRVSKPDFLVLENGCDIKAPKWIPGDIKWHEALGGTSQPSPKIVAELNSPNTFYSASLPGKPEKDDLMQLAHYTRHLQELEFSTENTLAMVIGKQPMLIVSNLSDVKYMHRGTSKSILDIYDIEFSEQLDIIESALNSTGLEDPPVEPELKADCAECQFRTICHDELRVMHHITLLPGITPLKAQAYYNVGIKSAVQLAKLHSNTAKLVELGVPTDKLLEDYVEGSYTLLDDLGYLSMKDLGYLRDSGMEYVGDLRKLHPQTAVLAGKKLMKLTSTIDQARVNIDQHVHLARGYDAVSIPRAVIEEDIDVEDRNEHLYLIGVEKTGRGKKQGEDKERQVYIPFVTWQNSAAGEAKVISSWWTHVKEMQEYAASKGYTYRLYCYTGHEVSMLRKVAERHAGTPKVPTLDELNAFFESDSWVDMYPIVSERVVWPTESHSLKKLASVAGFSWRDETPGGGNSLAWYDEATDPTASDYSRRMARKRLLFYNEDDVLATLAIRDWLTRLEHTKKINKVESLERWCRFYPA